MLSLLRRNHDISILKGDEKRFTVYINPITMQIYSDFFFNVMDRKIFSKYRSDILPFLGKSQFIQPLSIEPECVIISKQDPHQVGTALADLKCH